MKALLSKMWGMYFYIYYKCPSKIKQKLFLDHFQTNIDPFSSHLPILIGLGKCIRVSRVLELGSGLYSSTTFLNKLAFPELTMLHSIENNIEWAEIISKKITDDRFRYSIVNGKISDFVRDEDLSMYDVVFIDDSDNLIDRSETIKTVCSLLAPNNIIIIHDYENRTYQVNSDKVKHKFSYNFIYPNTGVLWNDRTIDIHKLAKLYHLIKEKKNYIPFEDVNEWSNYYQSNL